MEERLSVIDLFKSMFGVPKKGDKSRIKYLKTTIVFNIVALIICWVPILMSIFSHFWGYDFLKWDKMGLLVILSLGNSLNLPNNIYELKLLLHAQKLKNQEIDSIDHSVNSELKNIMSNLNSRINNRWYIIPLLVVILILALWQFLIENQNPYWAYGKLPILLFGGIVTFDFHKTYNKLTQNIQKAEANL